MMKKKITIKLLIAGTDTTSACIDVRRPSFLLTTRKGRKSRIMRTIFSILRFIASGNSEMILVTIIRKSIMCHTLEM